jgi:hypothetical protein
MAAEEEQPYTIVDSGRLDGLIEELAAQGMLFGRDVWHTFRDEPGTVEEAVPAVRRYLADPVQPSGAKVTGVTAADLAVALLQGARRALEDVQAIERAAGGLAREHGVTVRQLAAAAGMSERAANDRYRRLKP